MVVRYVAFDFDGNVAICEVNITVPDYTPPKLSCPQSYVIELVDKQDSYAVNFNDTRRRINATDASGEVTLKFIPERAVIPIRGYENVTVIASDKYGNKAQCNFQVNIKNVKITNYYSVLTVLMHIFISLGICTSNTLR